MTASTWSSTKRWSSLAQQELRLRPPPTRCAAPLRLAAAASTQMAVAGEDDSHLCAGLQHCEPLRSDALRRRAGGGARRRGGARGAAQVAGRHGAAAHAERGWVDQVLSPGSGAAFRAPVAAREAPRHAGRAWGASRGPTLADPQTVDLLLEVRREMDAVLKRKIEQPDADISASGGHILDAVCHLISTH